MNTALAQVTHRLWIVLAIALAGVVLLPVLLILLQWGVTGPGEQGIWQHLLETRLGRLTGNTLVLIAGVGCGVTVLGVSLAWLTASCEFPGRRYFEWALMLPLAVPSYVMAFVFLATFSYAGPVQSTLRQWFGSGVPFPEIQSAPAVILVFSLVLYPYVYMLARTAFLSQGRSLMEAARIMGVSPVKAFLTVALPVARPAIIAGISLALMETLADFGAVSVFNYDTFTTAIYSAWLGFFNLAVAAQLASLLLLFVLMALWLEKLGRSRARFTEDERRRNLKPWRLRGWHAAAAILWCTLIFCLAFVLPVSQLLAWALNRQGEFDSRFASFFGHTLALGAMAAVLTTAIALLLAFVRQVPRTALGRRLMAVLVRVASLGYALPGSVLAVGIMLMLTLAGRPLIALGSVMALMLAYAIRFLTVAFAPLESGLERIRPSLMEAARSLGCKPGSLLVRITIPMLGTGLLTALTIVFVDVMKEMPATLILRPFGWDTLAVRIYTMTAEGQWERAALPALTLILAGLAPVILLIRQSRRAAGR